MKIEQISTRPHWQQKCEEAGFFFHSVDGRYWSEDYCYSLHTKEIDVLKSAAYDLHQMYIDIASDIIKSGDYIHFNFNDNLISNIETSWAAHKKNPIDNIYSRFDFSYKDLSAPPKLLEYNADTPTTLLEAATVQAAWQKERLPHMGQFNTIDEDLVSRWKLWALSNPKAQKVFITCINSLEDVDNAYYMLSVIERAGLKAEFIYINEINFDATLGYFISPSGEKITYCFKLYPWEWLAGDEAFSHIQHNLNFVEPAWKLVLSNKAVLVHLWKRHKNHPNLLPTYWNMEDFARENPTVYTTVEKQIYGREGCNMKIIEHGEVIEQTLGAYFGETIIQQYWPLPCLEGRWPMTGVWLAGEKPCGLGFRDDSVKITQDSSWFAPHYVYD